MWFQWLLQVPPGQPLGQGDRQLPVLRMTDREMGPNVPFQPILGPFYPKVENFGLIWHKMAQDLWAAIGLFVVPFGQLSDHKMGKCRKQLLLCEPGP